MIDPHAEGLTRAPFAGQVQPTTPEGGSPCEYAAAYPYHNFPARLPADELRTCWVTIENRGTKVWQQGVVKLAIDLNGDRCDGLELPCSVHSGERVTLNWGFRIPKEVGRHEFRFELLDQDGTPFGQQGVPPLVIPFEITEAPETPTRRLRDATLEANYWFWQPGGGITWSNTGPGYPLYAREARGCHITDLEGRRFLDYNMGWGCALLGYAHERIQRAIVDALSSGAVLSLAHYLELEVTAMLCQMFPGAEAVTFGKNGSDVCTAAVRLARAHTGRPVILVGGYHGWQDWYVEGVGLASAGVPVRDQPLVLPFEFNNLEQVAELLEVHRGRVAAVMLEPASVTTSAGPAQDADSAFLKEMAALAHREGALVIFDEIFTGFRYRGGSVQHATGVIPDLTCLGKALSAGMPLSALVGRRDVFHSSSTKIFYEPTFKNEVYSFAAAREALAIYRAEDVPARLWDFGDRLKESINHLCQQLHAPAELVGTPFRMVLNFKEAGAHRLTLMRTLVE
jgi:glutamate-1-semialdehyde 2,1-aminomutase